VNILFLYPAHGQFGVAEDVTLAIGGFIPPLGLLYLGRVLQNAGHRVRVLDLTAEQDPAGALRRELPGTDAVGMTIYSGRPGRKVSVEVARIVRDYDASIPMILGGPHVSIFPQQALLEHQAQVGVQGEGEHRIARVMDALIGRVSFADIPGIVFRDGVGFHQTEPSAQIQDLDVLPIPARDLVRRYEYGYSAGIKVVPGVVTSMMTSRGCPFRCRFCQESVFLPKYCSHSAARIIEEIDEIAAQGYTSIVFADDNFLAEKKRIEQVMDHIIAQDFDLKLWVLNARVDSASRGLYEKMRRAGVEHIIFGVESGNQEILDYYNKKITLEQVRNAVRLSHEMGFFTSANFIIGAPIETPEHIQDTIAFASSLPLDNVFFKELGYGAFTPLWQEAVDQGKIRPDEDLSAGGRERGLGQLSSRELQRYCEQGYFAFLSKPGYLVREARYSLEHQNPRFLRLGLKMLMSNLINPIRNGK
jgi:anaerobic magnesium-protoporphyrin IX monomethyl ester cyclase